MMTVRSASRGYLLSIVVIALLVLTIVVAAMAMLGLSDESRALAFAVLSMVVLYLLRGMWIFGLAFLESPRFSIEASRGQLVIRNGRKEIRINSADVPAYYVYNNKIVFAAPLTGQDTIRPFVYVRAGQVTLRLYLLENTAKVLRALAAFDPEFVAKNKWNLGMVVQVIGMGSSP
ncbi:MAG: hypothetical protein K2Y27_05810 [Xanthobacteraceae bacterium]|nr:hypothetical protein [Xanthobacteraceae bacterium]